MKTPLPGTFDRVYTYARVSSTTQGEDGRNSIQIQENRLKSIQPRPDIHFRDIQGGDEHDRPGYQSLLDQVRSDALAGLKVLVVITEPSRLSREGSDKVTGLIELFDTLGACLYALDGGKQTVAAPHEWLLTSQQALIDAYFLRQHRTRLRSGNEQRRTEGRPVNPCPPFGYKWSREKYLLDTEKSAIAREIVSKYLPPPTGDGWSLARCSDYAREIGWAISPHGLRNWMKNPIIRGHLYYTEGGNNREEQKRKRKRAKQGDKLPPKETLTLYNRHDPIISETEYQQIEQRLKENRQYARQGTSKPRFPLSGLVRCGDCNQLMTHHTTIDKNAYGPSKGRYGNYVCRTAGCSARHRSVSERIIEAHLIDVLVSAAEAIASMVDFDRSEPNPEAAALQSQIADLRKIYAQTPLGGIRAAIEELEDRLERLSNATEATGSEDRRELAHSLGDRRLFERMDQPKKREVYHHLVQAIRVWNRHRIEVDLNF